MVHQLMIFVLMAVSPAWAANTAGLDHSGISQFWTDDYRVFDQVYGRTSDKELFRATLPPSITHGVDLTNFNHASDKKERYLDNDPSNSDVNDDQIDPLLYGSKYHYADQLQGLNQNTYSVKKPKKSFKFISTDFKPISQSTDPATYNYLKHLEQLQKKNKVEFPEAGVGGFKPYLTYGALGGANPEESDAYKSIQDILDAHESNKAKKHTFDQEDVKYITYGSPKGPVHKGKKLKSRPPVSKSGVRCPSGRCRKRTTNTFRVRTVPYIRKIKKIVSY